MNKIMSLSFILLVLAAMTYAQTATQCSATLRGRMKAKMEAEQRFQAKLNANLLIGIVNPAFEIKIAHSNFTVQAEMMGAFYGKNYLGTGYPYTLVAAWAEGRYYIKNVFEGFYAGLNIGCASYRTNKGFLLPYKFSGPKGSFASGQCLIVGPTIGYTFVLDLHWSIELSWSPGWVGSRYCGVTPAEYDDEGRVSDVHYIDWNSSGEWSVMYKGGVLVTYHF